MFTLSRKHIKKNILLTLCTCLVCIAVSAQLRYDFGGKQIDWVVVNDGVMGGLSQGEASNTADGLLFKGAVSLENNGGFASLRSPYGTYDLSSYTTITLRYRSATHAFAITLNKHRRFWMPVFKKALPLTDGEWKTISFVLDDFESYRLGKFVGNNPTVEDLKKTIRLGFISNEKRASPFEFEIDYIQFE